VDYDYAKRAEEIAKTDYIARASGCLLHWGSCKYLLGKSCDCDRREDVQSVADTLRGFDMAHLAELQAAHAAGVAEGKASERALEVFVVRSLAHQVNDGDDRTAEQLIEMLLAERDKLQMLLDPSRWPRFWVRWYGSMGVGFTLTSPWWLSGWAGDRPILVAAVRAPDAEAAKAIVKASHIDGGEDIEWSFAEARPNDWSPFCDRFQRADWMVWP
jgi:hypothetical protein